MYIVRTLPLHKGGGMKFCKNGYNGGDGKFLLEIGGSQKWGGWFYNGREDGKFLKSLYIVGRGVLTPLFYEDSPILPVALLFKCCPPPHLPCHLQPSPSLFFLLSCFFSWMSYHTTFDVLFYLMIISIYTCQALVS